MFRPMPNRQRSAAGPSASRQQGQWNPERWDRAGVEPRVEDLLEDPITRLVMRRDRIGSHDVMAVVRTARGRLARTSGAGVTAEADVGVVRCFHGQVRLGECHALMSPCCL